MRWVRISSGARALVVFAESWRAIRPFSRYSSRCNHPVDLLVERAVAEEMAFLDEVRDRRRHHRLWVLVEARDPGVSEAQLLLDYPALRAVNLVDARDYASRHPEEIAAEIRRNEVA